MLFNTVTAFSVIFVITMMSAVYKSSFSESLTEFNKQQNYLQFYDKLIFLKIWMAKIKINYKFTNKLLLCVLN